MTSYPQKHNSEIKQLENAMWQARILSIISGTQQTASNIESLLQKECAARRIKCISRASIERCLNRLVETGMLKFNIQLVYKKKSKFYYKPAQK